MSDCRKTELSVTEVPCGTPVLLHCMFTNALTGIKLFQVFLLLNLFRVFFLPACTLLARRHPGEGLGPCCCADINQSNSPEQHALQGQWAEGDGGVVLAGTWAKAACTSPVHGGVITSVMTGGAQSEGGLWGTPVICDAAMQQLCQRRGRIYPALKWDGKQFRWS